VYLLYSINNEIKYLRFSFESLSYISSIISLYKTVENKTYEAISEVLFINSLCWFNEPVGIEVVMYTAATYVPTKHWHLQKGFIQWGN
jgi:hypothetical protein